MPRRRPGAAPEPPSISSEQPDVSIVLLTYNGEEYLDEVLDAIASQQTGYRYETLAIDSGSSDGTLEILERHGTRVERIPNSEFGHGKTRNLGVRLSTGRLLVFLTQDATPHEPDWLDRLASALDSDEAVAGAYSRQIPRPDCNPCERRDIENGAGRLLVVKSVDLSDPTERARFRRDERELILFSNVSSCIRRSSLEQHPFDERIVMVEDQDWCKRVLAAGHTVIYEPASTVLHSHNFPVRKIFQRHRDYGSAYRELTEWRLNLPKVLVYTLLESLRDVAYVLAGRDSLADKLAWTLKAPAVRFAMRYGLYRGMR